MTAETRTLADVLASVRALLEARTVQVNPYGWVPSPAYAPLLALVREACPRCSVEQPIPDCAWRCRGTRYLTRTGYWEAAPNGAPEGALLKVLEELWRKLPPRPELVQLLEDISTMLREFGDTRIPALVEVETWLKREG